MNEGIKRFGPLFNVPTVTGPKGIIIAKYDACIVGRCPNGIVVAFAFAKKGVAPPIGTWSQHDIREIELELLATVQHLTQEGKYKWQR